MFFCVENCPLDLAAACSSVLAPSGDLAKSRSTTVSRSHPWLKSPPNRYPIPRESCLSTYCTLCGDFLFLEQVFRMAFTINSSFFADVKKGLVTNLAAGTSLITRVLLANADALCQFGTSSFAQSTENVAL